MAWAGGILRPVGTTVRLDIEYDGARFSGWARQPGLRTVQGELEAALATILREQVELTVAGRTDAGVHALGQVASFETAGEVPPELARRLNGIGPGDVAVTAATVAADGFDARRDATSRSYGYRVLARPAPSPFEHGRALWWPHAFEIAALEACAAALPGTHDFTAFTPTQTEHVRFERNVLRPAGTGTTRSPSSGSQPTPSCATWSASSSARCWRSAPAGAASTTSLLFSTARPARPQEKRRRPTAYTWSPSTTTERPDAKRRTSRLSGLRAGT